MIEVRNLTHTYPGGKGVFNLDFTIEAGEAFGCLGPNGAGKTTTIRSLLGFTNPNSGSTTVNGIECRTYPEQIHAVIGYLPGEIAFFDRMTGTEFLTFLSRLRKRPDGRRRRELLELFALDPGEKIRRMSKGMKQKLAIVAAFMHDPDIYILDEPTSGLDPFMQNVFLQLLEEEKKRGKTILLSSHIFEEVQRVCSRAGILREGRLVAVEDVAALNMMKQKQYGVTLKNEGEAEALLKAAEGRVTARTLGGRRVELTVGDNYHEFFSLLAERQVEGFTVLQQSLEDVFMKYYRSDPGSRPPEAQDPGTDNGGRI